MLHEATDILIVDISYLTIIQVVSKGKCCLNCRIIYMDVYSNTQALSICIYWLESNTVLVNSIQHTQGKLFVVRLSL